MTNEQEELTGDLFDLLDILRHGNKQQQSEVSTAILETLEDVEVDEEGFQSIIDDFVVDVDGFPFTVTVVFTLGDLLDQFGDDDGLIQ